MRPGHLPNLMETRTHVHLQPQCGACGDAFNLGERIVAILRKRDSVHAIDTFTFPDYDVDIMLPAHTDWFFCREPHCSACRTSPSEGAAVHTACFNLFRRYCTSKGALYRLWLAAAWRSPWRGAPSLRLPPKPDAVKTMELAAELYSLPGLKLMPPEISCMIWEYARPSLLNRYRAVIDLATGPFYPMLDRHISIPISRLVSWERGGCPVVEKKNPAPIFRITIDCRGVRRIERLTSVPQFQHRRSDTEVYITDTQKRLRGVKVQFESGLARLDLPSMLAGFQLWDMLTPPVLDCLQNQLPFFGPVQFSTIDVTKVDAITFLISGRDTLAIHGHTKRLPFPQMKFDQFSRQTQERASWIHVPFPPKDRITHFGVRVTDDGMYSSEPHSCTYLFRFELAGDLVVGPCYRGKTIDYIWPVENQLSLIYRLDQPEGILDIRAYPEETCEVPLFPYPSQPPFRHSFFSSAPLENIASLQVYTNPHTHLCRGILVEYENGSQRSLGVCRVGHGEDLVRTYENPVSLCFSQIAYTVPNKWFELLGTAVSVECQEGTKHKHDNPYGQWHWTCSPMQGTLKFWFTHEQTKLSVKLAGDEDD